MRIKVFLFSFQEIKRVKGIEYFKYLVPEYRKIKLPIMPVYITMSIKNYRLLYFISLFSRTQLCALEFCIVVFKCIILESVNSFRAHQNAALAQFKAFTPSVKYLICMYIALYTTWTLFTYKTWSNISLHNYFSTPGYGCECRTKHERPLKYIVTSILK